MGRTIKKMAIWLFVVWVLCTVFHPGLDRDPAITPLDIVAVMSLPFISYKLAKSCCNEPLFFLFGCLGTLPIGISLLDNWRAYAAYSADSTLMAIVGRMIVPIIGMGLLCRAMPALRDYLMVEALNPVCKHCGYNLTGNVSGICPECGNPIAEQQSK